MAFLANPCQCGWSLTDNNDGTARECERCKRKYVLKDGGWWDQVTPRDDIRIIKTCYHNRVTGEHCPHCRDQVAVEWRRA